MLRGYSVAAVSGILAIVIKACLHGRDDEGIPETPDEFLEASTTLEAALTAALDQWEQDILPKTNPTYRHEFRELRLIVEKTVHHQTSFGPTSDRPS